MIFWEVLVYPYFCMTLLGESDHFLCDMGGACTGVQVGVALEGLFENVETLWEG